MVVARWCHLKSNKHAIIDVELPADNEIQETQDNPEWQSAGPVSQDPSEDMGWNACYDEPQNMEA